MIKALESKEKEHGAAKHEADKRIEEGRVTVNGEVVIRPMMYVALSYDHRIIDGKDSVGFLVKVKELLENPERMFTGGKDAGELLLGI